MAAALQLLRARRRVLVIDAGKRRNRMADHAHGFLTQDGVDPAEIARIAREQLQAYPTLDWREALPSARRRTAMTLRSRPAMARHMQRGAFCSRSVSAMRFRSRGMAERWGKHVFHCPYCHGYELNQGRIGVIATSPMSQHQAALLTEWGDTTFFVNGAFDLSPEDRAHLMAKGVTVEPTPIARIEGGADVRLTDGRVMSFAGLFTASRNAPSTAIAERLGCELEETPFGTQIRTDGGKATSVPGVFACGDVARAPHSVSLAVAMARGRGANIHRSLVF